MNRLRRSLARKVLSSGALALLLMCVPMQLVAQERETFAHSSMLDSFAGLWSDVTAWLTGGVVPAPPRPESPPETQGDNGCIVDPHGECRG